jgi:hypothetical protein
VQLAQLEHDLNTYAAVTTQAHVVDYVNAVTQAHVVDYVNAVANAEAAQVRRTLPDLPAPAPSNVGGSCTGFSVPDYIIQRESGGNPGAVNPSSGAIGCTQTLPEHYSPGGACAGLDMHSVDGQRQCTWILSDGGTNLAPWALTR